MRFNEKDKTMRISILLSALSLEMIFLKAVTVQFNLSNVLYKIQEMKVRVICKAVILL